MQFQPARAGHVDAAAAAAPIELSVVMPCLNEADTLAICIRKARRAMDGARIVGEVIVADTLTRLDISYEYERRLSAPDDPSDFRLSDFTVSYEGDTYY